MDDHAAASEIDRVVEEHHEAVYRYAYRLTGSECDAEDLTQQVFLKAQEKLSQLENTDSTRGWLFAILRNTFFKSCRTWRPIPAASVGLDVDSVASDIPDEAVIEPERLQAALIQLPERYRLVLTMFYFEACSYRQIAEQLDVPIGTVMSRLSRAKRQLRGKLLEPVAKVAGGR